MGQNRIPDRASSPGAAVNSSQTGEPAPTAAGQTSELWGKDGEFWSPQSRLPDFSFAGYHFGYDALPHLPVGVNVKDLGAIGDGQADDTAAFLRAIETVPRGAIYVPAGRYKITQVLKITRSDVVLRGAGRDQTVLYFPYSLREMVGPAPRWAGFQDSGNWCWGGGAIWCEGRESGARLTSVSAPAKRGDATLMVASTDGLSAGMTIRLVLHDAPDGSLGEHLHAGYAQAGRGLAIDAEGRFVDWAAQIRLISGHRLTLDRPLRVDARAAWRPEIFRSEPSVREVGIEDLTIEFPKSTYPGHFKEAGYNGIFLMGVQHCWVRDVTILDADSGINVHNYDFDLANRDLPTSGTMTRAVTIAGLRLANRWRKAAVNGHHGIALEGVQDCLVRDFTLDTQFIHDLTVDATACGNVFSNGRGRNINFDHHRGAPYENLFTQIDAGQGDRLWACGGHVDQGPNSGARETLWNIRAADAPAAVPDWPQLTIVGMTRWPTLKTDRTWIEGIAPETLFPANLYDAQLARRHRLQRP